MPRKPPIDPRDAALWARVVRDVEPLPGRQRQAGVEKVLKAAPSRPSSGQPRERAREKAAPLKRAGTAAATASLPPSLPPRTRAPQAGTLDRRTRQRMLRGKIAIEARLDLHGFGAEEAHMRLRAFIGGARARGLRTVLVITGKGATGYARHTLHGYEHWQAPELSGRLRRLLPRWLAEPGIAEHVAGWQPAHPKHGGGGAFYVRLRRRR